MDGLVLEYLLEEGGAKGQMSGDENTACKQQVKHDLDMFRNNKVSTMRQRIFLGCSSLDKIEGSLRFPSQLSALMVTDNGNKVNPKVLWYLRYAG